MALLAKLRPCGPWRVGPDSGDRLRVGRVLHSDALYSALTHAFIPLGELDPWLEATAMHSDGAQVRLSSCFPFVATEAGDTLFLPPPQSHWPPPDSLRIRWKSARYVPPSAIWQLLGDKPLVEEHWAVDGVSECLLPVIRNVPAQSPFRVTVRSRAAVDRLGQGIDPHQTACLEFSKGSGIWIAFTFANQDAEAHWSPALKGALKLIADSGLGGERSSGWGRFEQPEFADGELGQLLFGNRYRAPEEVTGHWLLSLFSPAADDRVDWQQGNYRVVARTGRVESSAGWGVVKRANQMIAEGGVLVAPTAPKGTARDVAPAGFPHPVYRAGFALTIPIGKARPQTLKPAVVDKTLLESLVSPEPKQLVPTPEPTPEPEPTSEPRPSGSGPADAPEHPEPTTTSEPDTASEPRPSGSGSVHAPEHPQPTTTPEPETPSEPRPSGSGSVHAPEHPEPTTTPEPETPSEPRPSGSGLVDTPEHLEPTTTPEPETPSEPRPLGSGPEDAPESPADDPVQIENASLSTDERDPLPNGRGSESLPEREGVANQASQARPEPEVQPEGTESKPEPGTDKPVHPPEAE